MNSKHALQCLSILCAVICVCYANELQDLCHCQHDKTDVHFKEKKDKSNHCNVVELHINGSLVKQFNASISEQYLQQTPVVKFPGRKMVKYKLLTLALFKPVTIHSLRPHSKHNNVYVHWLISQIPSATSRFGNAELQHVYNLSPGAEYVPYLPLTYNHDTDDNEYILAFYHQHESKEYFAAHRYRKYNDFFQSLGELIICNVIRVTP
mmetsp:Transcript_28068/g.44521  ORF Transcript_28068/g.44521 Transcript_28068/m.44521 type:complete len:208 (-) Transcript_28068:179-802(-)